MTAETLGANMLLTDGGYILDYAGFMGGALLGLLGTETIGGTATAAISIGAALLMEDPLGMLIGVAALFENGFEMRGQRMRDDWYPGDVNSEQFGYYQYQGKFYPAILRSKYEHTELFTTGDDIQLEFGDGLYFRINTEGELVAEFQNTLGTHMIDTDDEHLGRTGLEALEENPSQRWVLLGQAETQDIMRTYLENPGNVPENLQFSPINEADVTGTLARNNAPGDYHNTDGHDRGEYDTPNGLAPGWTRGAFNEDFLNAMDLLEDYEGRMGDDPGLYNETEGFETLFEDITGPTDGNWLFGRWEWPTPNGQDSEPWYGRENNWLATNVYRHEEATFHAYQAALAEDPLFRDHSELPPAQNWVMLRNQIHEIEELQLPPTLQNYRVQKAVLRYHVLYNHYRAVTPGWNDDPHQRPPMWANENDATDYPTELGYSVEDEGNAFDLQPFLELKRDRQNLWGAEFYGECNDRAEELGLTDLDHQHTITGLDEPLQRFNRAWLGMDKTAEWMNTNMTSRGEVVLMGRQLLQKFNEGDPTVSQGLLNQYMNYIGEFTPELPTYILGDNLPNMIRNWVEGNYEWQEDQVVPEWMVPDGFMNC